MTDVVHSFDWSCSVVSVTDGDTVRLHLRREVETVNPISNDFTVTTRMEVRSCSPKGIPVRLVILNTPERGQPGYSDARLMLMDWLNRYVGRLRVQTYESAGWDRLLGDVYVEGERGNTATQYMLLNGWEPYVG